MKYLSYIVILLISNFVIAQNQALFEKANALYNDGEYAEAIDAYNLILENGKHSAEVYFNLANAHYKLNHIAPSIYNYEKALRLAPNDKDIRNNAAFARNMTIDDIEVLPQAGFSKIMKDITNTFSFDNWSKISIALVILSIVLFLLYYFSYSETRKRLSFVSSFLVLFIGLIALSFAFKKYNLVKKDKPAIVFSQESRVMSEPNKRSEESFRLHEGTKVQVLDSVDQWKKIQLANGNEGWVESEDIKPL
ncbi:tetratricopeptide repeat protein [Winogradskyella sp. 3972H.M.0a.05]|uniref:tetratricopeptide repeat protein n=1 Tax=Winogradskyella sp. 3972H.M.0a.05 TaxID=2950277 RepID=UPI0033955455